MRKPVRISLTAVTFVLVLLYCFPFYGEDSDPPHYYNVFNQEIWSDSQWFALGLAPISAAVVWFASGAATRRRLGE